MRTKQIEIANKKIVITEKTIGELKQLSKDLSVDLHDFFKVDIDGKTTNDIASLMFEMLESKLIHIFPQLNQGDIDNAYPSQLEELIEGFVEVNFYGVKKVFSKAIPMV